MADNEMEEFKKDALRELRVQRERARLALVAIDAQIADLEGKGSGTVISIAPVEPDVEAAMRAMDPRLAVDPEAIVNGPVKRTRPRRTGRRAPITTMTAPADDEALDAMAEAIEVEDIEAGDGLVDPEAPTIEHNYPPYSRVDPLPKERCLECSECPFATRKGMALRGHAKMAHDRDPTQYEMTPKKVPDDKVTVVKV